MREVNLFIYFKAFGIQLIGLEAFVAIEVFLYLFAVLYGWGVWLFCKGEELWRCLAVASAHVRFRRCIAEDVFSKLNQEKALLLRIEDIGNVLAFVLYKLLNAGVRHEIEILVRPKVTRIGLTDLMFYMPVFIANHESVPSLVGVLACFQNEPVKLVKCGFRVNEDLQYEILHFLGKKGEA